MLRAALTCLSGARFTGAVFFCCCGVVAHALFLGSEFLCSSAPFLCARCHAGKSLRLVCAGETGANVGGSPTGGNWLFALESLGNCVAVKRGGEQPRN